MQSVGGAVGAVVALMHSVKARLAFAEPLHFRAERVHCCAEAVHRCLQCPPVGVDACCGSHDQHRQPDAKGESGPDYRADDGDEFCGEHGHGGYHLLCKLLVEVWILSVPLATATAGVKWHEIGQVENAANAGWTRAVSWPLDLEEDRYQGDAEEDARKHTASSYRPSTYIFGTALTRDGLRVVPSRLFSDIGHYVASIFGSFVAAISGHGLPAR